MTASSSPSASSPPSSLVMNGNGQPIIVNGGSGGELIGNINNNNNNINNNNNNNNSSLEMNSTPVSNGSIDFDHKVPNGGNGSARCNGSNNNNNNNNSTAATNNSNCAPSQPLLHTESTVAEKPAAKTGPSAFKRPRDFLVLCLKHLFIAIVHLIVVTYTYLTLPIYTVLQEPSEIVKKAQLTRAKQMDPNDLYSPWVCDFGNKYPYILDKVKTIDEMVSHLGEYFSLDRRALGYRRVLREYIVYGPDGKTPLRIDGRVVKKRELSDYQFISFEEMIRRKNFIARGLHLAGVKQHDKIVILCETCAEYLMMELAIANAGAVQVNVFSTLGDSGIAHAINETKAKFIFTSFELLGKTRSIIEANKLDIQKVFYIKQRVENPTEDDKLEAVVMAEKMGDTTFVPLDGIERDGELRGKEVESQCKPLDKDEIAFIMYTSGTTGVPKGVQATSYQFVQLLHAILPVLAHIIGTSDRHLYVAYLPQAHIFEATCEFLAVALGAPIGFANPFTLSDSSPGLAKGTLSDMRLLKPTIMIAVPLVLERMRKEIFSKLEARSPISAPLFNYLMDYKIRWTAKGYKTPIVNKLLCEKIREQFGGNLQKMILGGAPLSASLQALINAALDLKLVQGYGMTETLGACLCMDDDDLSYGRCGRPLRGVYARLEDWHEGGYQVTDSPRARGELIIGSKANSLSYLDKPEMNAELYEYDAKLDINWFRTGDIAEVYEDGTFKIIDRKKDLVKLANGEYFSLGKIESILKNCSYVDNICVFGNALANYLVALVVPNQNRFGRLAKSYRVPRSEWNTDTRLINLVHKSLRETGLKNGLKKAEIPTKIRLVSDEWTPDNGLLTAAMKLKRSLIKSRYEYIIQELFTDPDKTD